MKKVCFILAFGASFLGSIHGLSQTTSKAEDSVRTAQQKFVFRDVPRPSLYADGPFYSQPVFQSIEDSIIYYSLESQLRDPALSLSPKKIDSMRRLSLQMSLDNVTRYRKIYRGSPGFIQLGSLPSSEMASTKKVSIYKARRLPKQILQCKSVEELEFVNCRLRRLPRKLGSLKLKAIRIYDNQARASFKLTRNQSIERLLVRGTNPKNIPSRFNRLGKLRSLDLSTTGIEKIPESIFKLDSVRMIKLSGNKITLKDFQFPVNATLKVLELGANKISTVPSSIGNLTGLISLSMSGNDIEEIESGIGRLQKLTQLSFYKNKIKSLPKDIYNLSNLREIDLYYNQLERLDEAISQWQKMEILYLSFNKLITLPESINSLTSLRGLYAHDNRLSSLAGGLENLSNLKVLRINNNYLMTLPNGISALSSVENIDLSNNNLSDVPDGLWNLKSLQLLSLGANPWNETAWESIQKKAAELRLKQVVVNVKAPDQEVGNQ